MAVDAGPQMAAAEASAREVQAEFRGQFLFGALAACLAGLCVVMLVWQSERLARQRSRFAASAAHELRTPLAGLRMYGEMLAEGLGDPARKTDYARRIADEAERLGRVVANVLGFTRLERGTLNVRPESGDLAACVRECAGRLASSLAANGARLELEIESDLPPARFDPDAVAQIVQNLLDNAEKYSRAAQDRTIHLSLEKRANGVRLTVRDHGPGLGAHARGRLFKPFRRGSAADDAPAGLGLGLVLVRALARAQGAQVSCRNAPGGGAEFVVLFAGAEAGPPS